MKVFFRVDSSMEIGTGHVMRCLTLANKIKFNGGVSTFICRDHEGQICSTIKEQGHSIIMLPRARSSNESLNISRGFIAKLGGSLDDDALETINAIGNSQPDWLVVDNYEIDSLWHAKLKNSVDKILAIDDVAERMMDCDVLLNQNLGCHKKEYNRLLPEQCELLIGTEYALLRPQFHQWRKKSFSKREKGITVKNILITFGGLDIENLSGIMLDILDSVEFSTRPQINIVLGKCAPHYQLLLSKVHTYKCVVNIHSNVTNMAELMFNADISIGAAGSTSWERCCLGLPAIVVVLANNQMYSASQLEHSGAVINLGCVNNIDELKTTMENIFPLSNKCILK